MKQALLNEREGETLIQDILQASPSRSVSDTADRFMIAFNIKDRFRASCALFLLLEDQRGKDLDIEQRTAAYYILCVVHCGNWQPQDSIIAHSPMLSILLALIVKQDLNAMDRRVIYTILYSGCPEGIQRSLPKDLVSTALGVDSSSLPTLAEAEKRFKVPQQVPWKLLRQINETSELKSNLYNTTREDAFNTCELEPPFIRPLPPTLPIGPQDFFWLHPAVQRKPANKVEPDATANASSSFKQVLQKGLEVPLLPAEQQQLLSQMPSTAELLSAAGFTPTAVSAVVENNPSVAIVLLKKYINSPHMNDYFSALANIEMSFHSMEVFNTLISEVEVLSEFTNLYITNCISTCQKIMDKYLQNRLVRLLCVFLQSLIRNKVVQIQDMLIEVQAFCIEFSRIKEAAALFRLLKSLE